jgi:hypothetical protein
LPKLIAIRDIWKYAYQEYQEAYKTEKYILLMWRAMYYYLGGTEELPDPA